MAKKKDEAVAPPVTVSAEPINLGELLSTTAVFQGFKLWLVGDTPLITHAWSKKAKDAMLQKQVKATKPGKEPRDPHADFVTSLYEMTEGVYGFPATGVKNAILASAHKDKGLPRTSVRNALWLDSNMVRVRPALAGAICDMPLIRVYGCDPEMREDMVKIGAGLNKTASLAYRGQFTVWAMKISGRFDSTIITPQALAFLINSAGIASGLGEWRNERNGVFGSFHLANVREQEGWDKFLEGTHPMPIPDWYQPSAQAAE